MKMAKLVTMAVRDSGVAVVKLNRPKALNALSLELWLEIERTALELRKNSDVRAVVLAGEGRAFCSGLDIRGVFQNGPSAAIETLLHREEGR